MSGPQPVSQHSAKMAESSTAPARPQRQRSVPALVSGMVFPPPQQALVDQADATSAVLGDFIRALLSPEDEQAAHFVDRLLDAGMTPQSLYEDCFTPAARLLGEMWEQDECSFYDVTVGAGRIQRMVRELSHRFLSEQSFPGSAGRILLGCAPGEQHSLGVAILAEYFVRDGWDVQLSSGVGAEGLLDKVRESEYNLVGLSVSGTERVAVLRRQIQKLKQVSRNRDIRILVGGYVIASDPTWVRRLGADGFATDAGSAVREARRMMGHN
jgi:MerR family transcriptional regulator, light-induced transcriptional regulator